MCTKSLLLSSIFALSTSTPPTKPSVLERDSDSIFTLEVWNNCASTKKIALYQVTDNFQMLERSKPTDIDPKGMQLVVAPYKDLGMRLSAHAEWGTAEQWKAQALFEFGYSECDGKDGTAYNLSVMEGSDRDVGIGVYPMSNDKGSEQCPSKTCFPWDCPSEQGWTSPQQIEHGSPADTVCYHGKTDFKVVFCP